MPDERVYTKRFVDFLCGLDAYKNPDLVLNEDLPLDVRDAIEEFESDRREWNGDAPDED